jgi:hypothetical protein
MARLSLHPSLRKRGTNPGARLAGLIASMRAPDGRITIAALSAGTVSPNLAARTTFDTPLCRGRGFDPIGARLRRVDPATVAQCHQLLYGQA